VTLHAEGDTADIPSPVVTSRVQGAHTISTMNMGLGLKIGRPTLAEAVEISKVFEVGLDEKLGIAAFV
jgi:hypothetical protein